MLVGTGSLAGIAGCISFGSPSHGSVEIRTESNECEALLDVSGPETTVVSVSKTSTPGDPLQASFELEQGTAYTVTVSFTPVINDIDRSESVQEHGWNTNSGAIEGQIDYSSEDQVYTIRMRESGVLTVEYRAVSAP